MYSYTNPSERMTKRLDSGDPTLKHLNNIDGFMVTASGPSWTTFCRATPTGTRTSD